MSYTKKYSTPPNRRKMQNIIAIKTVKPYESQTF